MIKTDGLQPAMQSSELFEDLRRSLRLEREYFHGLLVNHAQLQCQRQEEIIQAYLDRMSQVVPHVRQSTVSEGYSSESIATTEHGSQGARAEFSKKRTKSGRLMAASQNMIMIAPKNQQPILEDQGMEVISEKDSQLFYPPLEGSQSGDRLDRSLRSHLVPYGDTALMDSNRLQVYEMIEPLKSAMQRMEAMLKETLALESRHEVQAEEDPTASATQVQTLSLGSESESSDRPHRQESQESSVAKMISKKRPSGLELQSEHSSATIRKAYEFFEEPIRWWNSLEEPPRTGRLAEFVDSTTFESICAVGILLNMLLMLVTTNHEMELTGKAMQSEKLFEICFVIFFGLELLVKLIVHRVYYFCSVNMAWNIFDFVLVLISIIEQLMAGTGSAAMMRSLRTFKLAKILRGARLMRFFTQLSVMLNSLLGSLMTLFWSFVMLGLLFYLFGVVLVQGVASYLTENDMGRSVDPLVFDQLIRYFGSIEFTMLTLYKTTFGGDDWSMYYDLMARTGATNAIVFIAFVSLMHIAMLNILTGIFVESALKLATPDREVLACRHRMQKLADEEDFKFLFAEVRKLSQEPLSEGFISKKALEHAADNPRVRAHMEIIGMTIREASMVKLFFPGKQEYTDELSFIETCHQLRGSATSIDLHMLLRANKELVANQRAIQDLVAGNKPRPQSNHRKKGFGLQTAI